MNISVRVSRIFQIKVADLTLNTELVNWGQKNLIFGTKIQLCNFRIPYIKPAAMSEKLDSP